MQQTKTSILAFVMISIALLVIPSYLMVVGVKTNDPEIQMGLVIVIALATLMILLFIVAAGFSFMELTDPKQALGLPEGSIRAMIALILIMVFIIFGLYLFRMVGSGFTGQTVKLANLAELSNLGGHPVSIKQNEDGTVDVNLQSISADGSRLAQQLITTVGTLVVAVAGFYFGSSSVSSAVSAVQGGIAPASQPVINSLTPAEGNQGETLDFVVMGTNFRSPKTVRLVRGSEEMVGTEILSRADKISCKILIDKGPDGKWDVIVENEDGGQARLAEVFTIKQV